MLTKMKEKDKVHNNKDKVPGQDNNGREVPGEDNGEVMAVLMEVPMVVAIWVEDLGVVNGLDNNGQTKDWLDLILEMLIKWQQKVNKDKCTELVLGEDVVDLVMAMVAMELAMVLMVLKA